MFRRATFLSLLALVAVPAGAQATPVAAPAGASDVREFGGTIVFSQFSPAEQQWRLAIRRAGAAPEVLTDVRPQDRQFQADIGPDSAGRPALVYQRCDEQCDLATYSLTPGRTGERPIRNANDPDNPDVAPTLWKGRIAWARIFGEQADRKVIVYTKTLTAPRSRPSTRLPGVPTRRTRQDGPGRSVTVGRAVDALELAGDRLAQIVSYTCDGCGGMSSTELRLVGVARRTSTPVGFQTVGLSGQQFVGPSFADGALGFYRACLGDPSGCQGGGATPYRYDLATGKGSRGAPGPAQVFGFADAGATQYRVEGCNLDTSPEFNAACRIEEVASPAYAAASIPQRD